MPLPSDDTLLKVSEDLVAQFQTLFGKHPGLRPAHARGLLLTGYFIPSTQASSLSSAPHFAVPTTTDSTASHTAGHTAPVPVTVRFSSSTGCPAISDIAPDANPRGIAIRFHLGNDSRGRRTHTDIIAHSTPSFPTRTGAEFLEMLRAVEASKPVEGGAEEKKGPSPIEQFIGSHPSALAFVTTPKPSPTSFASENYHSVNAYKFINDEGVVTYGRYLIESIGGVENVPESELSNEGENYLYDELKERIRADKRATLGGAGGAGGGGVEFIVHVQVADESQGDVTDDGTKVWPSGDSRKTVDLGRVILSDIVGEEEGAPAHDAVEGEVPGVNAKNAEEQRNIIFDPIPRVKGIEPSDDPLLEVRAAVYLISGTQRRAAGPAKATLGRAGVEA